MNFLNLLIVGLFYFGKRNIWNFLVIFVLVAITGIALYQSALDIGIVDRVWWSGMWQNFSTEMIGAIMTFALFEMLINANNRQEELIRQMASADNATAINAANELRALGYLLDGSLYKKSLKLANLASANLSNANLAGINLSHANLQDAILLDANLKGADLREANLHGAKLTNAQFDETTILPDNQHWSQTTQLQRYTQSKQARAALDAESVARPQAHPYRAMRAKRRQYR
jgi:hypothetical protein